MRLRAERNGSGNGRVYTIVYLVTDASGLERQVECKVSVPKDKPGPRAVEGPGPGYSVNSECISPLAKRSPGASSGEEIPELLEARDESLRLVRDPERGIGVEFSLENQSPVTIDVYDIAGRRVQTLRAVQPAGPVTEYWDGRDLSGRTVATGIYFFRVQAAGVISSGKALWTR